MMTREILAVLNDPASSRWLKHALIEQLQRDPVDALRDAECVARLLAERLALLHAKATDGKLVPTSTLRADLQELVNNAASWERRLWP